MSKLKEIRHTFYYMGKVTHVTISGEEESHVDIFDKKMLGSMGRYRIRIDPMSKSYKKRKHIH